MTEQDHENSDGYEIEKTPEDLAESTKASKCPNCGAPLPEQGTVCASCGFDRRTGSVTGTKSGIADAPTEAAPEAIISHSGIRAWLIIALIASLILVIAWFAGWSSLFSRSDGKFMASSGDYTLDSPRFWGRFFGIIRWGIAGTTLVLVGGLALRFTAKIVSRPAGEWAPIFARLAMIVATAGLATLLPLEPMWLEWVVQLLVGIGLVALGCFMILRLRGAQLGIFLAVWVLLLAALLPVARLIAWSFGA